MHEADTTSWEAWSQQHPEEIDFPATGGQPVYEPSGKVNALKFTAAGAGVVAAVLVGALAGMSMRAPDTKSSVITVTAAPPSTVMVTAEPSTSTPPATPTIIVAQPTQTPAAEPKIGTDTDYLRVFTQTSAMDVTEPEPVIALGHAQCDYLSQPGATVFGAVKALMDQYHALTRQNAYGFVYAAVTVYCPRYKGQL